MQQADSTTTVTASTDTSTNDSISAAAFAQAQQDKEALMASLNVKKVYSSTYCKKDGTIKTYHKQYIPKDRGCFVTDKEIQRYIKALKKRRDDPTMKLILGYIKTLNIDLSILDIPAPPAVPVATPDPSPSPAPST